MGTGDRLPGGNLGGAVRIGDTVRRRSGPWTPSIAALLKHLEAHGFQGAPRFLGIDDEGREVVSYIPGETVGTSDPWPAWVHADDTLDQVADWLRDYHDAVEGFVPPRDAVWRTGEVSTDGGIVGHNDVAPYNAVWRGEQLVAFIDWEFAAPSSREWDLALLAFSWVPLHARSVVEAEGFVDLDARPARLRRLLARYGWDGNATEFIALVQARARSLANGMRRLADEGDAGAARIVSDGQAEACECAAQELDGFVV